MAFTSTSSTTSGTTFPPINPLVVGQVTVAIGTPNGSGAPYNGGTVNVNGTPVTFASGTTGPLSSGTNYIQVNSSGTVSASGTIDPTQFLLGIVNCNATVVTAVSSPIPGTGSTSGSSGGASVSDYYVVTQGAADLPNSTNLGSLGTGFIFNTVTSGTSSLSSSNLIPNASYAISSSNALTSISASLANSSSYTISSSYAISASAASTVTNATFTTPFIVNTGPVTLEGNVTGSTLILPVGINSLQTMAFKTDAPNGNYYIRENGGWYPLPTFGYRGGQVTTGSGLTASISELYYSIDAVGHGTVASESVLIVPDNTISAIQLSSSGTAWMATATPVVNPLQPWVAIVTALSGSITSIWDARAWAILGATDIIGPVVSSSYASTASYVSGSSSVSSSYSISSSYADNSISSSYNTLSQLDFALFGLMNL